MPTKITNIVLLALIATALILGVFVYPSLPDQVASHWNAAGQANGHMQKFWGVFLVPLLMLVFFVVYAVIPKIDPLSANIESFRKSYNAFWVFMSLFLLYVYALMLAWNFGYRFNFSVAMVPAIALLFYVIGFMIERAKRNWFVGIRTPWTLSSDVVWDKTHKLGGKLFKLAALILLFGLIVPGNWVLFATVAFPAFTITLVCVVYSYVEFKKEGK